MTHKEKQGLTVLAIALLLLIAAIWTHGILNSRHDSPTPYTATILPTESEEAQPDTLPSEEYESKTAERTTPAIPQPASKTKRKNNANPTWQDRPSPLDFPVAKP